MKLVYLTVIFCVATSHASFRRGNPLDARIIGGETVPEGGAPYMASLRYGPVHFCGASILNDHWVLTAAHCATMKPPPALKLKVYVGSNKLSKGGTAHAVEKIVVSPKYDPKTYKGDIALLKLSEKIVNDKVQYVKLPKLITKPGTHLLVTGWGVTQHNPDDLRMLNQTSLSFAECKLRLALNPFQKVPLSASEICALQKPFQGICFGDFGSPLVKGGDTVVGVASRSVLGCAVGFPDIYTRVLSYKNWITNTINAE